MGEGAPAAPPELVRGLGVAKDARLLLGEDAFGRERAQDSMQRLRFGPDLLGQLLDRLRPVGERLGDVQVGRAM